MDAIAVVNCLQDFADDIKSEKCKARVHSYLELAAQDIRFDVPLADACHADRLKLCSSVPPVRRRHTHACVQDAGVLESSALR